jgi:hypothetical protein
MIDSGTIVGVVAFVVIFVTAACIFEKTHKRCFGYIDKKNEHSLLKQEYMTNAQDHKEQRDHDRFIAQQKRQHEREDHEHERSQRTSARTQPHNEHHEAGTQAKADERHAELIEAIKSHHGAPHRESSVFGATHPSHATAAHSSGSFFGGHETPHYATVSKHTQPHTAPHTWSQPIRTIYHPPVPHGGSFVVPHSWVRTSTELHD